jgi:threonine dehydrogenase-like Zn-dependent dehydrogenase
VIDRIEDRAQAQSAKAAMRAAVFTGPQSIQINDAPLPEPAPTQVRVRLEGCGVCASNLPVWEGRPWFQYPLEPGAPGHEGWGVVEAVGADVTHVQAGDRVAMLSYHAYAEYDIAEAEATIKLPAELNGKPFLGEPLGCAMNVFRRSDIQPGQTVAIVGIGFLGAILTALATKSGARVIAITRRPFALDIARQFGAAETIVMDDHWRIIDQVKSLTGGQGCERVIEAVGMQWPLDLSAELTRERGKLIVAGYHQDGPRQVNMQMWNWRGLDVINAHERDPKIYIEGMQLALKAVLDGTVDPAPLYTHTFDLDHLADALRVTEERPDGFMKALVTL